MYAYGGTASGVASGIASWRNIIIDGGTVTAFGGESKDENNYGIGAPGALTINGGTVNATGGKTAKNSFGVGAEGDISITGGDINATGGTASNLSHGVGAEGNISISGGELNANTGAAPYAFGIGTKKRLSYQWKVNKNDGNGWTDISGATQTSYTTQTVDKGWDGFQYKCVVSNSVGSVESEG